MHVIKGWDNICASFVLDCPYLRSVADGRSEYITDNLISRYLSGNFV